MATQRYISTSFWDDEWIQELDPSEKLLYLYLMTNPLTNIAGVYKITDRRISFDTGFNIDTIRHIFVKFENAGKAYRKDEYIIIPSWPKHQKWEKVQKIRDGIISELQNLPEAVIEFLDTVEYQFDLSLINKIIIARKQRKGISGTTVKKLREKYNNRCAECGGDENLQIHHIVPIKDGGDNAFENLLLLCDVCHRNKHRSSSVHISHVENFGHESKSSSVHNYSDLDSDLDLDREGDIKDNLVSNDACEVEDAFETPPSPPPASHQKTGKSKACGTHRNVFLTSQEYSSLSQTYGKDNVNTYINKLSAHMKIHGKSYLDHSAVLLKWLDEDGKTKPTTAREPPPAPTKCDRCGKPLVNGVCEPCGRRLYSQGGFHSFEDIADPSEMAEAIGKLRSAFAGG